MIKPDLQNQLERIGAILDGEMHVSSLMRNAYSTDASVYRETPVAVAIPRTDGDIQRLIKFAGKHQLCLVPRAAEQAPCSSPRRSAHVLRLPWSCSAGRGPEFFLPLC